MGLRRLIDGKCIGEYCIHRIHNDGLSRASEAKRGYTI